jgi:hypothetical protein
MKKPPLFIRGRFSFVAVGANRCRPAHTAADDGSPFTPFTYSAALIGGLLISAFWLHRIGGLSVRLPLRFLSTHLGTRLGALGLLRGGRLSLHLPLGVLRRGCNISAGAVHGACRRMLLAVIADAHCLAGTLRCRSGPCILQIRGAAGGVTWASQCSSGAQDDDGATSEN